MEVLWFEFNFGLYYFKPDSVLTSFVSAHDNDFKTKENKKISWFKKKSNQNQI